MVEGNPFAHHPPLPPVPQVPQIDSYRVTGTKYVQYICRAFPSYQKLLFDSLTTISRLVRLDLLSACRFSVSSSDGYLYAMSVMPLR